jgi:hypothetical protein
MENAYTLFKIWAWLWYYHCISDACLIGIRPELGMQSVPVQQNAMSADTDTFLKPPNFWGPMDWLRILIGGKHG